MSHGRLPLWFACDLIFQQTNMPRISLICWQKLHPFFYSAANLKTIWWEGWEKTEWLLGSSRLSGRDFFSQAPKWNAMHLPCSNIPHNFCTTRLCYRKSLYMYNNLLGSSLLFNPFYGQKRILLRSQAQIIGLKNAIFSLGFINTLEKFIWDYFFSYLCSKYPKRLYICITSLEIPHQSMLQKKGHKIYGFCQPSRVIVSVVFCCSISWTPNGTLNHNFMFKNWIYWNLVREMVQ